MKPFITSSDHLESGVWPFGKVKALLQPQGMLSLPVNIYTLKFLMFAAMATMTTTATATTATAIATTPTTGPVAATVTDPHVFHNVHLAS